MDNPFVTKGYAGAGSRCAGCYRLRRLDPDAHQHTLAAADGSSGRARLSFHAASLQVDEGLALLLLTDDAADARRLVAISLRPV